MSHSKDFGIISRVNAADSQPVVEFRWGDQVGELTPDEARAHALKILAAADAAESDAFMVGFLRNEVGASLQGAAGLLQEFRVYRNSRKERTP